MRLLKHWNGIDPARSIWGLTLTIAQNVLRDEIRLQTRRPTQELDTDLPTSKNLEEEVLARMELARVGRCLEELTASQRSVLLAEVGGAEEASSSPAAVKMMRMRARRRLRTVLERASAVVAGVKWRIESEVASLHASLHRNDLSQGSQLMSPAAGVLSALTIVTAALAITEAFPTPAEAGTANSPTGGSSATHLSSMRSLLDPSGVRRGDASTTSSEHRSQPAWQKEHPVSNGGKQPANGGSRIFSPIYADAGSEGAEDPMRAQRIRLWADAATEFAGHRIEAGAEAILKDPDCTHSCTPSNPAASGHASLDEHKHDVLMQPGGDDPEDDQP